MKVHLSLPVQDPEATGDFYTKLFQSAPVKIRHDYVKFTPEDLPLNISFHRASGPVDTHRHLGIEFADRSALNEAHARLKSAGLVVQSRDESVCCYALQDKFHVVDPDGYAWELYYLVEDTDARNDEQTMCCSADGADSQEEQNACGCN